MKIFVVKGLFADEDNCCNAEIDLYVSKELAAQAIKKKIEDEIQLQIDNKRIEKMFDGSIKFVNADENAIIDIRENALLLDDGWGFYACYRIVEKELIKGGL